MISGIVYSLRSKSTGLQYIGSSQDKQTRFYAHFSDAHTGNSKVAARLILCDDFEVITLEEGEYDNELTLRIREQYWIDNSELVVNIKRAHTPPEVELERKKKYWQLWYKANSKDLNKRIPCPECGKEIYARHMKDHLEAPNHNKKPTEDEIRIQQQKTKEMRNTRFLCPCGGTYMYTIKAGHFRSVRHQDWNEWNETRAKRYTIDPMVERKIIDKDVKEDKSLSDIGSILYKLFDEPKPKLTDHLVCECGQVVNASRIEQHRKLGLHKFMMEKL